MGLILLLLLACVPASLLASQPRVNCLPAQGGSGSRCATLGCEEAADLTCTLAAGSAVISELPAPVRPDELKHPQRLVAALDSQLAASGFLGDRDVVFTVTQKIIFGVRVYFYFHERNPDYSIPQAECFSPCVWDGAAGCWLPGPLDYGYTVNGPVENTTFGWRVPLRKFGASLYNAAVQYIDLEIFVYSESLVRFKIYDPDQQLENTTFGWRVPLRKFGASLYNAAVQYIDLEIFVYSESLVRFKIYDPDQQRFEVPIALNLPSQPFTGQTNFDVVFPTIQGSIFFLQVVRKDTGTVIFDTSMAGITFEDQLLSIALRLPSRNLYGLGENYHATFRRELDDYTWPLWSHDELPSPFNKNNLYGVHPFYEVVENDGKAHGVLFYNSNAMEYQLQSAAPAVVWRTIGGILDFYVVTGPTPEEVVKQYTSIVGRSFLPPYWSLGFQQSRWGYNTLENMSAAVERTISCGIPLVNTMDREADFTIDPINFPGLPAYVDEKRSQGMRYVPIVDPAIASGRVGYETYDRGLASNSYIRLENGDVLLGNVWPPEPVSFPDFFRSNTSAWWTEEIRLFYQTLKFDGLWIDMNEPANFETNIPDPDGGYRLICPTNSLDDPPYTPTQLKLEGDNNIYSHYDVHSLYGYSETIPTSAALQAVTGKRGLVFTRSSFVGSGILGGHWTGDNYAYWDHMQYSVIGLLDFNLFGLPYVGADICGFAADTEERLCQRWQELGAFYPFSRNHNAIGNIEQDPCIWPDTVGASTRTAMNIRYRLLPYFYTMFYRANQGLEGTVIRSLMHQANRWPRLASTRENAFGLVIALDEAGAASGDLFWDDGESIDTVAAGQYHYSTLAFADNSLRQSVVHPSPDNLLQGKFVEDVEVFGMATQPTGVTGDVGTNVFIAFDANNQKVSLLNAHIPADIDYVVTFTFN
ncbi:hypothetical protein B566_EDAN012483 [Ephemera danica]|nr:hypothetical protein B566_EDAN012483 [Ephemera danica]